MPFFQNPFFDEFSASLLLGDRHHSPTYVIKGNAGRGKEIVNTWKTGPYNLSGNDADGNARSTLKICFSLHNNKNWATLSIDVTAGAVSTSAVTGAEIVAALNADTLFKERFIAEVGGFNDAATKHIVKIRQKKPMTEFTFYIINGQAEESLGFNARAGIAELPSFFARHTIANRFNYSDSQGNIIELDPDSNDVDAALIDSAVDARGVSLGFSSGTVREDWQLLVGKSGIFNFQKITVDGSDRITEIIEYPAGAKVGDFAKKTNYTYTSSNKSPSSITEIPYTLESGDLVTPP